MNSTAKNNTVLERVVSSLVAEAVRNTDGIALCSEKRRNVSISFLPNEKVDINLCVSIDMGRTVPATVALLQENVKKQIEGATKFGVHCVNVEVAKVNVAQ